MQRNYWGIILLSEIFFLVFLTGFFSERWNHILFPIIYAGLYLTTAASFEKNKRMMLWLAASLLVAQTIFTLFDMPVIEAISKFLNLFFFSYIVVCLIREVASAKIVTRRVIFEAVNGYLLMGLVYTFLIALMIQFDPSSFSFSNDGTTSHHDSLYFGFVTFATLGYGDLLPLKPYAKSLSILIAVSGQLYVAVIIALLVGKFSSQSGKDT